MVTRDLSNTRIQLFLGLASAISAPNFDYALDTELNGMLKTAPAVRWDGLDFGMQASEQIDDRSLDDDATATLRGFMQFGGGVPLFFPKATDTSSILRQTFNLVKTRGTELVLFERIGWVNSRVNAVGGDNGNLYRVMTDGFQPDTEGTGGYAYLQQLVPRGDVSPWTVVGTSPAAQITTTGGAITGVVGDLALRRATYLSNDITRRATWTSSNTAVAIVTDGIVELVGAGTANIVASYPGATDSAAITVTASAS